MAGALLLLAAFTAQGHAHAGPIAEEVSIEDAQAYIWITRSVTRPRTEYRAGLWSLQRGSVGLAAVRDHDLDSIVVAARPLASADDTLPPSLQAIICTPAFTWPCSWALRTTWCESSWDPNAVNPAGPYRGLFQVLNGPLDPYLNAVEAHIQFREWQQGIRAVSPWPVCAPYRP